jgi:hypothetical protein
MRRERTPPCAPPAGSVPARSARRRSLLASSRARIASRPGRDDLDADGSVSARGDVKWPAKLSEMHGLFSRVLDEIKAVHGQHTLLHVFPVMPVSLAVELGARGRPKRKCRGVSTTRSVRSAGSCPRSRSIRIYPLARTCVGVRTHRPRCPRNGEESSCRRAWQPWLNRSG